MRVRLFTEIELDDVEIMSEIQRIKADHPEDIVISDMHVADSVSRQVEGGIRKLRTVKKVKCIFIPDLLKEGF